MDRFVCRGRGGEGISQQGMSQRTSYATWNSPDDTSSTSLTSPTRHSRLSLRRYHFPSAPFAWMSKCKDMDRSGQHGADSTPGSAKNDRPNDWWTQLHIFRRGALVSSFCLSLLAFGGRESVTNCVGREAFMYWDRLA